MKIIDFLSRTLKAFKLLFDEPKYIYYRIKYSILSPFYQNYILPSKVRKIRRKEIINVLFVLSELGSWKTESLYNRMRAHSRFNVNVLLIPAKETPGAVDILKDYFKQKKYDYKEIITDDKHWKDYFSTDIIFYQKPYGGVIDNKYFYLFHMNSLFCYVLYAFRNRDYPNIKKIKFINFIWQFYAENNKVIEESIPVFCSKAKNMVCTGLPIMDDFLLDKSSITDPWKRCGNKKRIIYAPHHTISSDIYEYATFLDYYDFMLEMAEKYVDKVQWAFKPHPVLKGKLYDLWGVEKTDGYYRKWEMMDNCQISEGEYMGLFKHSDAMIHDCGSFKLEYLYARNPVMFLQKKEPIFDYSNWQTTESLKLHYIGYCKNDIENFIINVINNVDPLKDERDIFVDSYLTPPHEKSACENIINAILGQKEYANK